MGLECVAQPLQLHCTELPMPGALLQRVTTQHQPPARFQRRKGCLVGARWEACATCAAAAHAREG
eukprot:COSAG02_NODE_25582_length_654_cov_1.027027_2_plen_65_part_00